MVDNILLWHESLPPVIKLIFDFWFITIFLRGMVAKKITHWLDDHGMGLDGVTDRIKSVVLNDTRSVIWHHYRARSLNAGHQFDSIEACGEEACAVIR